MVSRRLRLRYNTTYVGLGEEFSVGSEGVPVGSRPTGRCLADYQEQKTLRRNHMDQDKQNRHSQLFRLLRMPHFRLPKRWIAAI